MSRTNPEADPSTDAPPDAEEHSATVEVDIDHAAEDVWTALTSDEGLSRWMGDGATIVPEPDGTITVPDPATGRPRQGNVDHLENGERLDFTWWPIDDPDDISTVTIELQPTIEGTRIRVTETAPTPGVITASATPATATATSRSAWAWRMATLVVGGVVGGVERVGRRRVGA